MSDPRIEQIRKALGFVPVGTIDCDGDKCRQLNCFACYEYPTPAPGPTEALAALSSLEAEVSRDWQEIHDALDGKPAPGAARLLEAAVRIDDLRTRLAAVEALVEKWRNEQAEYPPINFAAAAVRVCATELEAALSEDS